MGIGAQAKMGIGASSTVDQPLEFMSEGVALRETFLDTSGYRGMRGHPKERKRAATRSVGGSISFTPTPLELDYLLPRILGGTKTTNTIPLAETLPSFYLAIDRIDKVYVYDGCKVANASFSASAGGPLQVSVNLIGIDETVGNAGSFPAIDTDITGGPYILADCVLTIAGVEYQVKQISVSVDNGLEPSQFNSNIITRINETDRIVQVGLSAPLVGNTALYNTGIAGVAVVATFTNGTRSISMTMPGVQFPRESPTVQGRGEIMLPLNGIASRSGTSAEITFTNDSTV